MKAVKLVTSQISDVSLQHLPAVTSSSWILEVVPPHHLRQPGHVEDQLGLLVVLQVDDVGEVGQAGRAVRGVEAPVQVLDREGSDSDLRQTGLTSESGLV